MFASRFIVVANFIVLMFVLLNTTGDSLEHLEDHTNYETIIENHKLKLKIFQVQEEIEILKMDLINNTIPKELPKNEIKKIDCMVSQMQWDAWEEEYVETDYFVKAPSCYEVLE